jgi:hypothetical protein
MGKPLLDRRAFFAAAGATTAGIVGLDPAFAASGANAAVVGSIKDIRLPAELTVQDSDATRIVRLHPKTIVTRDGVAGLSDFSIGEEVAAEGSWSGDALIADSLATLYRVLDGVVLEANNDQVVTTAGRVWLVPHTRFETDGTLKPADPELRVGRALVFMGRRDPASGELIALRVYPK